MATQTIERTESAIQEEIGAALTSQVERFTTGATVYSPVKRDEKEVEEENTQAVAAPAVQLTALMRLQRLIGKIGNRFMAYPDSLSGPGETERDRIFSERVRAKTDWTNYW